MRIKDYNRVSESSCTKKEEIIPDSYNFLQTIIKLDIDIKLTPDHSSNQTSTKISDIEKDLKRHTIDSKKTRNRYDRLLAVLF